MTEQRDDWIILPFRGQLMETKLVGVLEDALLKGRVELLNELVVNHTFSSEELQSDAEMRATRLVEQVQAGGIDYVGEGPYPAHWRMDANRGVFHYAGTSPWCFDAYRLVLDICIIDPPPASWQPRFPKPDAGALDSGGTLWDFFGDFSNEGDEFDSYMAKLFDSMPVWLSPPEVMFSGFLSEGDTRKQIALIEGLGEGRLERSFYLREFHAYLKLAQSNNLGLTAAALPQGLRWQDEKPHRIEQHW